jgi:hypothetical protein
MGVLYDLSARVFGSSWSKPLRVFSHTTLSHLVVCRLVPRNALPGRQAVDIDTKYVDRVNVGKVALQDAGDLRRRR